MSGERPTGQVCSHDGITWRPISDDAVAVFCDDCDLHAIRPRCQARIKSDRSRCLMQPVKANGFCEVHGPYRHGCRQICKDGHKCEAAGLRKYGGLCRSHYKVKNAKANPRRLTAKQVATDRRRVNIVQAVARAEPQGLNVRALRALVTGSSQKIGSHAHQLVSERVLAVEQDGPSIVYTLGEGASGFLDAWT